LSRPTEGSPKPHRLAAAAGLLFLVLGACQPRPATIPEAGAPAQMPEWPAFDYEAAARAGRIVYRLDPQRSRIDVVARSDGPLARFGHDHAVVVAAPEGYLLLDDRPDRPLPARADLRFETRRLEVDAPDARGRHGLASEMSEADVAGTRRNLLEKVLDADTAPWVTLAMSEFQVQGEQASAAVEVALQGRQDRQRQPFRLRFDEGRLTVEGRFVLRHSDLGLTPYTAFGGSLRVADPLEVHFTLVGVQP
jgi:hypothetical protein